MIVLRFGFLLLSSFPADRLFGIDKVTIVSAGANLINIIILAVVLSILLYRPVRGILHKRTEKIRDQLTQAEEEMSKAIEMRQQYEQKIEEIGREREDILAEARKQATDTSQRIVASARDEAASIKERAAANVEVEWERAQTEMRTAIIEVSAALAEKFVTLAINKETHDRLFAEAVSDLEGMTWRD